MSVIYGNPVMIGGSDIKISRVLDENSWSAIKLVSSLGTGANFWAVGDCKQITMNGKVSDGLTLTNYSAWVYIIGFNHNAEREGNGITFQGFKATDKGTAICLVDSEYFNSIASGVYFSMNNTDGASGGWANSQMRKNVMPLIKAAFPADLREVIKISNIFTAPRRAQSSELTVSEDEVFLLAEFEVFGIRSGASTQEPNYLKQYSYYSAGNSKVKYKHNATSSAASWWERSLFTAVSGAFCTVSYNGSESNAYEDGSLGVSPCFKV